MLLALNKARRMVLAAPALAFLIGLPTTASGASAGRDPTDDRSLLCDLIGLFCGPGPDSDPDHPPPVPAARMAPGLRSAPPVKSFPDVAPPPPPPPALVPPPPGAAPPPSPAAPPHG